MGQPLIIKRTMTQLTNATLGTKPNESNATMERLLAAAASEGARLSLMLFSLDEYADVREQPSCLRKAVTVLLSILLKQTPDELYIDCPSPNEFLAVLPSAPLEQVEQAAEEIRNRFTMALREVKTRQPLEMTLSGTVAAFPQDGETRLALFNRLRSELLRLREEGGNRVRRVGSFESEPVEISLPTPLLRHMQAFAEAQGEAMEALLGEAAYLMKETSPNH